MPGKKRLAISLQRLVRNTVLSTSRFTLYALRSQTGSGQLILVMLLLAGLAVGTYVVQHQTNLIPHADDGVKAGYCESNYVFNGGDAGQDSNWSPISESSCDEYYHQHSDENSYLCGKAGGNWQDDHCSTGGSSENNSSDNNNDSSKDKDNNEDNSEGDSCVKDGYVFKYSECTNNKPGEVRDVCQNSKGDYKTANVHIQNGVCGDSNNGSEKDQKNDSNTNQNGQNSPGNDQSSNKSSNNSQYDQGDCRDNAPPKSQTPEGYTWIAYCSQSCTKNSDCSQNKSDGAVNPDSSNWCYGFNNGQVSRCLKLVQSENKELNDSSRKDANSKAVSEIKSNLAQGNNPNPQSEQASTPTQSSSVDLKAKIAAQLTSRSALLGELGTALNNAGTNSTLKTEINQAQSLLNSASTWATTCYTGNDKPLSDACDGQAQAANDIGVAAGRVAMFDSIMAGGSGCVKIDMAVGEKTTNSKIEVKPVGSDTPSRLFMCRGSDGTIQWKVRDDNGNPQDVSQASLNELGLKTGQKDASSVVPQDFINRRNTAADLSSQPKYSSSTADQQWQEVAVSNCLNNCSSFPSGATCYQKGNQYNCNGSKPTTSDTSGSSSTSQSSTSQKSTTKQDKNGKCEKPEDCKSNRCNTGTNRCI